MAEQIMLIYLKTNELRRNIVNIYFCTRWIFMLL